MRMAIEAMVMMDGETVEIKGTIMHTGDFFGLRVLTHQ